MSQHQLIPRRSIFCNGKLISHLRKRIGWTQSELARRAGFTERLIVKAEASQSIAAATLEIISQTFTEAGLLVTSRDLASDPATLAKLFFFSICEHGPDSLERNSHFISEQLVVHFAGDPQVFPFAGTHFGIDAAKHAFAKFHELTQPHENCSEIEIIQFYTPERNEYGTLVWGETNTDVFGKPNASIMKFEIKMNFRDGLMNVFDYRFDTLTGSRLLENAKSN